MAEDKKEKSRKQAQGQVPEIEDEEKLRKANEKKLEKQIIVMFIILALLLVSFLAAYELFKPKAYFKYEGLTVYMAKIQGVKTLFYVIPISGNGEKAEIVLRYDPRELNVSVDVNESLAGISHVWITYPPYESDSNAVIAANDLGGFATKISLKTEYGMTDVNESDYPQITCENATKENRVFLITLGNETRVYERDNCVIVEGENYDGLVKAADALVLKWLLMIKQ
jgi:hypothetical protein